MTFGKNVARRRKLCSYSQQELANRLDVTATTIGNWERGLSLPCQRELEKLAETFGVSVSRLWEDEVALKASAHPSYRSRLVEAGLTFVEQTIKNRSSDYSVDVLPQMFEQIRLLLNDAYSHDKEGDSK